MGCFSSKSASAKAPQATQAPAKAQNPPPVSEQPAPVPAALVFYKPIADQRKILYYSSRDKVAFELPVSTPFKFKPKCAVALSVKKNRLYCVGGFTGEDFVSAQSDDFSDECMTLEINYLTGKKTQYPTKVGFMTLLIHTRGEEEDVYCVGGCQLASGNEDVLEQGTFAMQSSNLPQWESLPALRHQKFCCPVSVLLNNSIYCAGGFLLTDSRPEAKDSIMMYRIQTRAWNPVQFKFPPIFECLAAQLDPTEYLIFNTRQTGNKAPTLTLTETKLLNSPIPDCPDKDFWYPVYQAQGSFSVISEDHWLYTFDKTTKAWSGLNLRDSIRPTDFSKLPGVMPRTPKYFAFHVDPGENTITEYNTVSNLVTETRYKQRKICKEAGICVMIETGEILLLGGKDPQSGQLTKNCFGVTPGTERIRPLAALPMPQQGIRVVQVNKQIYALAGFNEKSSFCQLLDSATQNWVSLATPPQALEYPVCFCLSKTIYMIGGQKIMEKPDLSNEVYAMNTETKTWAKMQVVYPFEIYRSCAIEIQKSGTILIFGGDGAKDEPIKNCFQFDGQQFRPAPNLEVDEELIFEDPPCYRGDDVFIYTRAGQCFRLNLETLTWSDIEGDDASESQDMNRA